MRKTRHSVEYVSSLFQREGYVLLSSYVDCDSKVVVLCPYGHKTSLTLSNFCQGHRCSECYGNRKRTIEEVRVQFEKAGYQLISTTYKNSQSKLDVTCPKGHKSKISWTCFQQGTRCAQCAGNIKYTIEQVRSFMATEGYILLSTSYKREHDHLQVQCPKGHVFPRAWADHLQGVRCPECFGKKKYTLEEVQKKFEERGYKLLSTTYERIENKLVFQCPQGHIESACFKTFLRGRTCTICSGRKRLTLEEVQIRFEEQGYKLLATQYKGTHSPLDYICPKGHKNRIRWYSFRRGERCPDCWQWRRQRELGEILEQLFPEQILLKRDNLGFLGRQKVDYALPHLKMVIEYDGEQHYRPVVGCFGVKTLKEAKKRLKKYQRWDKRKDQLCKENDWLVVRIRYDEKITLEDVKRKIENGQ